LYSSANDDANDVFTDYYLGKQQNAVTNTDVLGEAIEVPQPMDATNGGKKNIWQKVKDAYYRES